MHTAPRFVINMIQAGASGYLIKDCAFKELAEAVRLVALKNQIYLSPSITDIVVRKSLTDTPADSPIFTVLSSREREVLQLIVEGKSNQEMAEQLCVNFKTIESHRTAIFAKLKISSIAELTKFAIREGITAL
jgi:DNA-binding NarL/FixJ family response regulator